jgi:hypothetical protein
MAVEVPGLAPADYECVPLGRLAERYVAAQFDPPEAGAGTGVPAAGRVLQRIAMGAALAHRAASGWHLDAAQAVAASWEQVARARGQDVLVVRGQFAAWVAGQAGLHRRCGLSLDEPAAAAARRLLDPPQDLAGPGQ